MVKKLLSLILSALIAVSCFPIASQAAETDDYASGASTVSINAAAGDVISVIVSIDAASNVQGILLDLDKAYSNFLYTGYEAIDSNVENAAVEVNSSPVGYTYTDIMAAIRFKDGGVTFNQKTDLIKFNFRTVRAATNFTYGLTVKEFYDKDLKDISANKISIRYVNASDAVKTLSSIKVTSPNKTTYYVGETFDKTGIVVNAVYSDGSSEDVTSSATVSSPSLSSAGTKTVTVSYTENNVTKTATFSVTVKAVELSSIAVTAKPTTTTYYVGQSLNTAGMKITATYTNGTTADVTNSVKTSGFDSSTAGTKTVTVFYTEGSITRTASFSVTIKAIELSSIAVTTKPTTTTYYVGQSFNSSGMKITATYNNGTTKDVTSSVKTTGFDSSTAGTKTITVSYTENGITKTTGFSVTILAKTVTSLTVTAPTKTTYYVGDSFDKSGLVVNATYNDNSTVDVTNSASFSGFDSKTIGEKTITVSYGGKTATFKVNVIAVPISSISLNTTNAKTQYYVGDTFDKTGIVVTAKYDNGTTADVTSSATFSGFSSTATGNKTVTASYSGKTATFTVNVAAGLTNTSTVNSTSIKIGETATVTGKASGGSGGYLYAFYYRLKDTTAWTTKGTPYAANVTTMSFSPVNQGTYEIKVDVKDSVGHTDTKILTLNVGYSNITNNSTISYKSSGSEAIESSQVCVGDTITLTGKASGGSGSYKYTYAYSDSTNSDKASKTTTDTSYSFKPQKTGKYTITVTAEDSSSSNEIDSAAKTFTVTVNSALVNNSTLDAAQYYVGDTVKINGSAGSGTSPYTYTYKYKKSSATSWSTISDGTASFKAAEATTYDVQVTVTDKNKRTAVKTIEKVNVSDTLKNLSTINKTAVQIGKTFKVTGKAEGGAAPYTYAFYYKKPGETTWTLKSDFGKATTVEMTPSKEGTYKIKVVAKDSYKAEVSKENISVDVKKVLKNNSTVTPNPVQVGKEVNITGAASDGVLLNGNAYSYSFYYKEPDSETSHLIQNYGKGTTAKFTPKIVGEYTVIVNVTDSNLTKATKEIKLTVNEELKNNTTVNYTTVQTGIPVKFTGSATGGVGTKTYNYSYRKTTETELTTFRDYSTTKNASITFNETGTYKVVVSVKDKNNTIVTKTFTIYVKNPLTNTSKANYSTVQKDSTVKITGSATGGVGGNEYEFSYLKPGAEKWVVKSAYGVASAIDFTPSSVGEYQVKVKVKDNYGTVAEKILTIDVTEKLKNTSTVSSTSVQKDQTVTITGSATGGVGGNQYEISYLKPGATEWVVKSAYGKATSVNMTLGTVGTYKIKVNVKDKNSTVAEKEFSIVVSEKLKNNSTVSSQLIVKDQTITLTGAASGGKGSYSYEFSYLKPETDKWVVKSAYGKATSVNMTLGTVGTYKIKVSVKDSSGTIATKEFSIVVNEKLKNVSTVSSTSVQTGTKVTIDGLATGGTGDYVYSFSYKKPYSANWTVKSSYDKKATSVELQPTSVGTYQVLVKVKDSNGTEVEKILEINVYSKLTNTSTVSSEETKVGTAVKVTGSATGGTGKYSYQFSYKKPGDTEWNIKNDFGKTTSTTITPSKTGVYQVQIIVKDASEKISAKIYNITVNSNANDFESQVVSLVNAERAKVGLSALKVNTDAAKLAAMKAQDMHDNNYFDHISPTYGSPGDMLHTYGVSYMSAGENIAKGQQSPEEVVTAWMNSEGHRANILSDKFTEIGVGYVSDGNYWVQIFIG